MKYNIMVSGDAAVVEFDDQQGAIKGTIKSADHGEGTFVGNRLGPSIEGTLTMDGYVAKFSAKLNGKGISGRIRYGWFITLLFNGVVAS